jgi:hypothetical protein
MKPTLSTLFALFLFLCASAQEPTPQDFMKAKANPVWAYHSGCFDSLFTDVEFHICDSLLVFYEEMVMPMQSTEMYVVSAKTGKLIRKKNNDLMYYYPPNGTMIARNRRTISGINIYSGKDRWAINIDTALSAGLPNKGAMYYIRDVDMEGDLLYIRATPEYFLKAQRSKNGTVTKQLVSCRDNPDLEKRNSMMMAINTKTGKVATKKHCLYNLRDMNGDTVIEEHDSLTCSLMSTGKILWRYRTSAAYDDERPGLVYYDYYFSNKNTMLLYKHVCMQEHTDSTFIVSIDTKTGREMNKIFLHTQGRYTLPSLQMPDSTSFFNPDYSLSMITIPGLQKAWSISADDLNKYKINTGDDNVTILTDNKHAYLLDSNSSFVCVNKATGIVTGAKKYGHHIYSTEHDFSLLNNFAIVQMDSMQGCCTIIDQCTYVINKNNPDDFTFEKGEFIVLGKDEAKGVIYLLDKKASSLLKVKLPQ